MYNYNPFADTPKLILHLVTKWFWVNCMYFCSFYSIRMTIRRPGVVTYGIHGYTSYTLACPNYRTSTLLSCLCCHIIEFLKTLCLNYTNNCFKEINLKHTHILRSDLEISTSRSLKIKLTNLSSVQLFYLRKGDS